MSKGTCLILRKSQSSSSSSGNSEATGRVSLFGIPYDLQWETLRLLVDHTPDVRKELAKHFNDETHQYKPQAAEGLANLVQSYIGFPANIFLKRVMEDESVQYYSQDVMAWLRQRLLATSVQSSSSQAVAATSSRQQDTRFPTEQSSSEKKKIINTVNSFALLGVSGIDSYISHIHLINNLNIVASKKNEYYTAVLILNSTNNKISNIDFQKVTITAGDDAIICNAASFILSSTDTLLISCKMQDL